MRSPVNAVKAVSSKARAALQRRGQSKFLIRPRRRARLEGIDLSNPRQYHYFSEIVRRRGQIIKWLEAEKEKTGYGGQRPLDLARAAHADPAVESLLKERDRRIIFAIADIAGIKKMALREQIFSVAWWTIEKYHLTDPEQFLFSLKFNERLAKEKIPEKTRARVKNALKDWLDARVKLGDVREL